MIKTTTIETPLGEMAAAATREGICLLEFSDRLNLNTEFEEHSLDVQYNGRARK